MTKHIASLVLLSSLAAAATATTQGMALNALQGNSSIGFNEIAVPDGLRKTANMSTADVRVPFDVTGGSRPLYEFDGMVAYSSTTPVNSSSYQLAKHDRYIAVRAVPTTIVLADAGAVELGSEVVIKDETGASGSSPITVNATAGDLIDGSNAIQINSAYGAVRLRCDGASKWYTIP